jgi:hypothetical protein
MHRRMWERVFAAVMAVWLAVVVAEPAFLHSCPMHGSAHSIAPAAVSPTTAAHEHHAPSTASEAPSEPVAPAGHYCTCLGDCGLATTAVIPPAVITRAVAITTISYQLALPASEHTPPSPATLLPFANGPPVTG